MRFFSAALAAMLALAPLEAMATPLCDAVNQNLVSARSQFQRGAVRLPDAECDTDGDGQLRCYYLNIRGSSAARERARAAATEIGQCVAVEPVWDSAQRRFFIQAGTTRIDVNAFDNERHGWAVSIYLNTEYYLSDDGDDW